MDQHVYNFLAQALPKILISFALLIGLNVASGAAIDDSADIIQVRFSGDSEQTRIVIETREELDYRWFILAQNGLRLVIDMPVVKWAGENATKPSLNGNGTGYGVVTGYRFGKNSNTTSRLVFDLSETMIVGKDFYLAPAVAGAPHRLVLDLKKIDPISFAAEAGFNEPFTPTPLTRMANHETRKDETAASRKPPYSRSIKRVVVIDAGHGGKDPGAVSSKLYEKNVNLLAAKELKKRLEKSKKYTVRLTRSTDVFITLMERVKFAREQGADLLISLHADAAANKNASGASVYTLIEWAGRRSKPEVMRGDPSIIGVDVASVRPGVDDILLNLSQRQTQNKSAMIAEILTKRMAHVSPMVKNAHRDKNLFVLLAPDVPSVLVEMGFISNKNDERNLRSERYIRKLMDAVGDSVDEYFKQSERLHASR